MPKVSLGGIPINSLEQLNNLIESATKFKPNGDIELVIKNLLGNKTTVNREQVLKAAICLLTENNSPVQQRIDQIELLKTKLLNMNDSNEKTKGFPSTLFYTSINDLNQAEDKLIHFKNELKAKVSTEMKNHAKKKFQIIFEKEADIYCTEIQKHLLKDPIELMNRLIRLNKDIFKILSKEELEIEWKNAIVESYLDHENIISIEERTKLREQITKHPLYPLLGDPRILSFIPDEPLRIWVIIYEWKELTDLGFPLDGAHIPLNDALLLFLDQTEKCADFEKKINIYYQFLRKIQFFDLYRKIQDNLSKWEKTYRDLERNFINPIAESLSTYLSETISKFRLIAAAIEHIEAILVNTTNYSSLNTEENNTNIERPPDVPFNQFEICQGFEDLETWVSATHANPLWNFEDKFKAETKLRTILQKYNGFCELICNRILKDQKIDDDHFDEYIKNELKRSSLRDEFILNSHIVEEFGILRQLFSFLSNDYPLSIFSRDEQKKLCANKEIDLNIFRTGLERLKPHSIVKFGVYEFSLSMKKFSGHSMLIYKKDTDNFSFFDPCEGLFKNLSIQELSTKAKPIMEGRIVVMTDGLKYIERLEKKNKQ